MVARKHDTTPTDETLLALLATGNETACDASARLSMNAEQAFEMLYHRYAKPLYQYAAARVAHPEDAEEIIQNLFVWLWEKREQLVNINPVKPYLYGAIRHRVADHLAHHAVRYKHREHILAFERTSENSTEAMMNVRDLETMIEQRIATLPVNCQTAYRLSRQEQLSIAEVAERMKISTGTVENYITRALKELKATFLKR